LAIHLFSSWNKKELDLLNKSHKKPVSIPGKKPQYPTMRLKKQSEPMSARDQKEKASPQEALKRKSGITALILINYFPKKQQKFVIVNEIVTNCYSISVFAFVFL